MSSRASARRDLVELARLYGVQVGYEDAAGARQRARPEALFLALRALGAPLASPADCGEALQARRAALQARAIEPVHVAWGGRLAHIHVRVPASAARSAAQLTLRLESGETRTWKARFEQARGGGADSRLRRLRMAGPIPAGYHELEIETRGETIRTRLLSAPRTMHAPSSERSWGVFAPVHALRTERDWGTGDYQDLAQLATWVGERGGGWVGTLPLLASFLDRPFEPSPYSPVSRLFWNELYVHPDAAAAAGAAALRERELVDYRATGALRRRAVAEEAEALFASGECGELEQFIASRPRLRDYARFRATCDQAGSAWQAWPARARRGELRSGDYDVAAERYYLYAQWQAERQLGAISAAERTGSAALYLDLPLGVNPDGYDAWRFRDVFVEGASAGAPPDLLFTGGQDWGFRPLHPERLRESGYGYLIECLRHHLRHARMLRLDHVMWLFRLYWIPAGLDARAGVYVQYPADELFAILAIESARHNARIVGEDLGTVPRAVRRAMERRQVGRIFVVQYELQPGSSVLPDVVPANAVASINTHDMPPFAAFLGGGDIDDQVDLDLIDERGERSSRAQRADVVRRLSGRFGTGDDTRALLEAVLRFLAASEARTVLINLEDLWLEEDPQNVPGTSSERPNWQRRLDLTLERIMTDPQIRATLTAVDELRRTGATARSPNV